MKFTKRKPEHVPEEVSNFPDELQYLRITNESASLTDGIPRVPKLLDTSLLPLDLERHGPGN